MKFRAIELNQLNSEMIENIRIWRNTDFVRKKMYNQKIISKEEHKKFIENIKKDDTRGLFVFFLDELPFGVYQYQINKKERSIINGDYLIKEEYSLLGYGAIMRNMIQKIIYYYFDVDIICGEILDTNMNSLKSQKQVNGKLVKVLKNHILIDDMYHDVYCFEHKKRKPDPESKEEQIINMMIEKESFKDMIIM